MDYTKNYHLPQWVKEDRIMMEDFNQMCADMEKGLTGNREEAREAAAELSERVDAAQKAADTLPYVVGSYVGTGAEQSIYLGFKPSYLIISGQKATGSIGGFTYGFNAFTGGNLVKERVEFTDSGFTVFPETETLIGIPNLYQKDHAFDYIAFR